MTDFQFDTLIAALRDIAEAIRQQTASREVRPAVGSMTLPATIPIEYDKSLSWRANRGLRFLRDYHGLMFIEQIERWHLANAKDVGPTTILEILAWKERRTCAL